MSTREVFSNNFFSLPSLFNIWFHIHMFLSRASILLTSQCLLGQTWKSGHSLVNLRAECIFCFPQPLGTWVGSHKLWRPAFYFLNNDTSNLYLLKQDREISRWEWKRERGIENCLTVWDESVCWWKWGRGGWTEILVHGNLYAQLGVSLPGPQSLLL